VLTLQMGNTTPTGSFTISVVGTAPGNASYTSIQLVVQPSQPFAISGNLTSPLAPGLAPQPLNLTLRNPNPVTVNVSSLTVAVAGTSAGTSCDASNFTVKQYTGNYPLTLAAGQSATLAQLGVTAAQQPQVQFLDKPTVNQDRCKGVAVNLSYSGTASGS
jgi:hypothetical protein